MQLPAEKGAVCCRVRLQICSSWPIKVRCLPKRVRELRLWRAVNAAGAIRNGAALVQKKLLKIGEIFVRILNGFFRKMVHHT
jgi:hypothetical protein